MNDLNCPYCRKPFSNNFISSAYDTLYKVTDVFYQNTPCCDKQMECYLDRNNQIGFERKTMKEADDELMEQIYYPQGRKTPTTIEVGFDSEKISYSNLLLERAGKQELLSYTELLSTQEWDKKRREIIIRDGKRCSKCLKSQTSYHPFNQFSFSVKNWTGHFWIEDGYNLKQYEEYESDLEELLDNTGKLTLTSVIIADKQYHLQVHHKYYIVDKLPWDYKDEALVTLCNWCHWDFHENNKVNVYIEKDSQLINRRYTICSRCNGVGNLPQYSHVAGGVCFKCGGQRYFLI